MTPRLTCAEALPWWAASRNHRTASVSSCGTPAPVSYMTPRLNCAEALPWSAASRNHRTALGVVLRDTPAGVVHHAEQNLRTGVSLLSHRAQLVELRRLRLHRRTGRERDQDGDGGNERLHAALLKRNAVVDADPTAGWQGVQCGGLRLMRVRGVPFAGEAFGLAICSGVIRNAT